MLRQIWWKLGALAFAIAAPAVVVALAVLWAWGTGPYEWEVSPHLMRGGLMGFAIVAAVAAAFIWNRRNAISGLEAGSLWLGLALAFVFTSGVVSNHPHLVAAPLGYGIYLWGGFVYGLAVAITSGVALAYAWCTRKARRGGSAPPPPR